MLRASAAASGTEVDLKAIAGGGAGDFGVPHGRLLAGFAEAVLGGDEARLAAIRERLRETLGDAALVDAAAVVANYSALDRVADATGIPLEAAKEAATAGRRAELGIDGFASPRCPSIGVVGFRRGLREQPDREHHEDAEPACEPFQELLAGLVFEPEGRAGDQHDDHGEYRANVVRHRPALLPARDVDGSTALPQNAA